MVENNRLLILLDTDSLKSPDAKRLLMYDDNDLFEFVAIKGISAHDIIWRLPRLGGLRIYDHEAILVTERKEHIKQINGKSSLPYISEDIILHPNEANIVIDLYCKQRGAYFFAQNHRYGARLWYWYSMKNKVFKIQQPWSIAVFAEETEIANKAELEKMFGALADRIVDILTAIDEIGQQFYKTPNNSTQWRVVYHFNYWITLYVGVLDNLALITKLRYQISIDDKRTGLVRKHYKNFWKIVAEKNSELNQLAIDNPKIVNLVQNPRNVVVHGARLKSWVINNGSAGSSFIAVRISEDFFERIDQLSKKERDKFETWGLYRFIECSIEPYRFVKQATATLIGFVNEYLETLNFEQYLTLHPNLKKRIEDSYAQESQQDTDLLSIFKEGNLGY